jgi:ubiquinone/menaquinone biosynthesis C-methylase UbiE
LIPVSSYHTEQYWDQVAQKIGARKGRNVIAGDDEPYYRYKRKLFLRLFHRINFHQKSVLEIGSGPGGNLELLTRKGCARIAGADISEEMIRLTEKLLANKNVQLVKTDGIHLRFPDRSFDLVFTSTVLQHNTNEERLRALVQEICRVADKEVILFERIEKKVKGHDTNLGRPVSYYADLFAAQGFTLQQTRFLPIQASYAACGLIRKLFNLPGHEEGGSLNPLGSLLQMVVLPVTFLLDQVVPSKRDVGMLRFERKAG